MSKLSDAYRRGYKQKSKAKIENYLTILNDLAEDTAFPARTTREKLTECLGYLQRCDQERVDEINRLKYELIASRFI